MNKRKELIMQVAATAAAKAYTDVLSKFKWFSATTAQEVAMLEKLETTLRGFPKSEVVYEFGHCAQTGRKSVQTVEEILNYIFSRKLFKSKLILSKVGGRVSELRREVMVAEMELGI